MTRLSVDRSYRVDRSPRILGPITIADACANSLCPDRESGLSGRHDQCPRLSLQCIAASPVTHSPYPPSRIPPSPAHSLEPADRFSPSFFAPPPLNQQSAIANHQFRISQSPRPFLALCPSINNLQPQIATPLPPSERCRLLAGRSLGEDWSSDTRPPCATPLQPAASPQSCHCVSRGRCYSLFSPGTSKQFSIGVLSRVSMVPERRHSQGTHRQAPTCTGRLL